MTYRSRIIPSLSLTLVLIGGSALAEPPHEQGGGQSQHGGGQTRPPPPHPGEPHPGPQGYDRVNEPHGWNTRPTTVDMNAYHHNFQASRSFRVGPYRRPPGWAAHHWAYGQLLPRAYWASQYVLSDYWLFALEVPPAGYEWVRDDDDALLVNVSTGEILQVEYGVFG